MDWLAALGTRFGLTGIAVAALLALLAFVSLPRGERASVRSSFVLLAMHVLTHALELRSPPNTFATRVLSFIATLSLLLSLSRSGFLLAFRSVLARRIMGPWPRIVRDVLQAFLYFVMALLALRAVGVEPGSLLTTSALLTAVIGLSLQDTLGNLFAGLALQAQPPFSVGDWIQYADGAEGIGRVIEINWRATHLVTIKQIEVIVPNAVMAKAPLRNFSRPTPILRHDITLVLPDRLPPERVRGILLRALEDMPRVLRVPEPSVHLGATEERGIEYTIRYFIQDFGQRDPIESEVRQRLWYALHRQGIEHPAPRRRFEPAAPEPAAASAPSIDEARSLAARLTRVRFLNDLDPAVLDRLASGTRVALYAPGEVIIRQGDSGDELFVIERGRVEVLLGQDATQTRVSSLSAGQFFGEAALLHGTHRRATIAALNECELLVISGQAFRAGAEIDPTLEGRLTSELSARLTELSKAVSPADPDDPDDDDRRSDVLIARIKQFFRR